MLYKEIVESEDCEICPLKKEEICPGGWVCYGGEPIEPPCCGFDDDTDVTKWVDNYWNGIRRQEDAEDERIRKQEEKEAKNKIAQQRRREAKWHVWDETQEIKSLKKRIAANEATARLAHSLALAFNTTNEMFGYSERYSTEKATKPESDENQKYRERIAELEAIKKQKLKELRASRK